MKIWLGGITNSKDCLELINQSLPYFDGVIFTVDDRTDQSLFGELDKLDKSKFHYLVRNFAQAHDWRANDWLHSGLIKSGDFVCIMDSTDRFNTNFLKQLRIFIEQMENQNINSVYIDRPFIFKFTGHQYFESSPHWGINNLLGSILYLSQTTSYKKEDYVMNTRDVLRYGIKHPIKYFCEYKRSNATQLLYQQFGQDIWFKHENKRVEFQIYVEKILGFDCTVENLIHYISEGLKNKNLPEYVIDFIETEVNMQDLVRFYILNQDFLGEIAKNRFNWSFKKFYLENKTLQNKDDGYVGLFNKYRLKQNWEME